MPSIGLKDEDMGRERNERRRQRPPPALEKEATSLNTFKSESTAKPVKLENNSNILFNQSKEEQFSLSSGFKKFQRELKNWKIITNRDEIVLDKLLQHRIFVTCAPQKKFSSAEIDALKRYVTIHNGSLLIMLSEGGETKLDTNINFLLEDFGIFVNSDACIRTTYFKYFNPKEALVSDGVLNRALGEAYGKYVDPMVSTQDKNDHAAQSLHFVYPFGATLNVTKPAVPVLSSGSICYPINRPLCAFYGNTKKQPGKIAVLGSVHIFHDSYLEKEENRKILDVIKQKKERNYFCNKIRNIKQNFLILKRRLLSF
jgi:intraflagellar transport protein 52